MDPQTSMTGTAAAATVAAGTPEPVLGSPLRILDILRERRATPARAVGAPAGVLLPEVARPLKKGSLAQPEAIPTLADLGGMRPALGIAGEQQRMKPPELTGRDPRGEQMHPTAVAEQEAAQLSTLATEELAAVPDARGVIAPPPAPDALPRFAAGVGMESIALPDADEQPHTQFPTALGAQPADGAAAVPMPPVLPSAPDIPSIHTLRDDMQRIMRSQSISVVKAAALEERKKQARKQQVQAHPAKKRGAMPGVLAASLVLLLLGGALAGGFLWYRTIRQAPLSIADSAPGIIFAEQSSQLSLTDTSPTVIMAKLARLRQASLPASSITRIIPTVTASTTLGSSAPASAATAKQFLDAIGAQAPSELTSAVGDGLFLGVYAIDGNQMILIIPVISYEHAFAGMLAWEPHMGQALAGLFPGAPGALAAASSTSGFSDIVIKNYDVRMLADQDGQPVLFYSFPTRGWLVITSSPYTFTEVLARLQAAGALQASQ